MEAEPPSVHGGDDDRDSDLKHKDLLLRLREWQDRNHRDISSGEEDSDESDGDTNKAQYGDATRPRLRPTNLEDEMRLLELVDDMPSDPAMTEDTFNTNPNTENTMAPSSASASPPNMPRSNGTEHIHCEKQITAFAEKCTALRKENQRLRTQRDRMRVLLDDVMSRYRVEMLLSRRKTDFLGEVLDRMRTFGEVPECSGGAVIEGGDEGQGVQDDGAWDGDTSDMVD